MDYVRKIIYDTVTNTAEHGKLEVEVADKNVPKKIQVISLDCCRQKLELMKVYYFSKSWENKISFDISIYENI